MPAPAVSSASRHQQAFHARWHGLRDAHVRALAWLLDAPDLMDAHAACWEGRIVELGPMPDTVRQWLFALDAAPKELHAHLARQPSARLGRYAEQLLGFYLAQRRQLVAANLQVRNDSGARDTLGEFDFLVRRPDVDAGSGLEHWEFATKFYLLEAANATTPMSADAFVGPNLADSLGRKMRKIMQRQLSLGQHPAATRVLPAPVVWAGALVKGWLFYRAEVAVPDLPLPVVPGIAPDHCRGFWCELAQWPAVAAHHLAQAGQQAGSFLLLPRLAWLAPACVPAGQLLALPQVMQALEDTLKENDAPVLVAMCGIDAADGEAVGVEVARGFVVPDGWRERAQQVRLAVDPV